VTTAEFGPMDITTVNRWTERDIVSGTCVSCVKNGEFQETKYF